MAMWVDKSSKRKEIDKYFSSINCMSLRIVEDINSLQQEFGSAWNDMTVEEQEKKINQSMVPAEVKKHYPLPDNSDYSNIFPALRIDTGQKIVEVMNDQSESPTSWYDEFSVPFSWETTSQMDLHLPPPDGSKVSRKTSSERSTKSKKNAKSSQKIKGNGNVDQKIKEPDEKPRKKSTKSKKSRNSETPEDGRKSPILLDDINFNFNNSEFGLSSMTFDLNKTEEAIATESFDFTMPEIIPSSELSKPYNESEFMDLYPQKAPTKPVSNEEVIAKQKSSKVKKLEKKPSKDYQEQPTAPPSVLRQKKTHRKKQSSGNQQVNPRSSLTLDGAIHNLEIAAKINKQGVTSDAQNEKVFNNEEDLLRQIEKDTDLDDWLPEPTPDEDDQPQKSTGFDFLDNW